MVDGMKMVLFFDSCFVVLAHSVLFRVMDQFEAAREGDLQQLRAALTVNNVNDVDHYGSESLLWAARYGHVDCVEYCIEMGASVNARNKSGCTPLHLASYHGHVNVVRVLLDAGAIVDGDDKATMAPLYHAIRFKQVEMRNC
jgi:ankyrin repeat protein